MSRLAIAPVAWPTCKRLVIVLLRLLVHLLFAALPASPALANDPGALKESLKRNDPMAALRVVDNLKDINAQAADGSTALLWASHYEAVHIVEHLLDRGADPTIANHFGASPLMEAAQVGNLKLIELLIEAGANPNATNPENQTALMAVARTGNVKAARYLLRNGADVNARENWGGQTALMWAAARHHSDMIELLIKHGADIDARATVRDWERRVTAEPRIKEMHAGGLTPLLYAARTGCIECVKGLVKSGADINLPSPEGISPLLIALLNNHFDTAKALIELGANPQQWDWWGRTPLYQAIDMNTSPQGGRPDLPSLDKHTGLDIARLLLEKGVDPNFQLKMKPPLRHIVQDRLADVMLSTGATPLLRAARAADVDAIQLLLNHGALVDLPNAESVTPLMAAAWKGGTRGKFKTEADGKKAIQLLLDAGANINAADSAGVTALHGAARQAWNDVVIMMVERGADVNAKDIAGLSVHDYTIGEADRVGFGVYDVVGMLPETAALLKKLGAQTD